MVQLSFFSSLARATPPPPPPRLPYFASAFTLSPLTSRTTNTSVLALYRSSFLDSASARTFLISAKVRGQPQHKPIFPPTWTARKGANWELESEMKGRVERVKMRKEVKIDASAKATAASPRATPSPLLLAMPPSTPPSSSSSSNKGRPPQLSHSNIIAHLLNSSEYQRAIYDASILRNFAQVRDRLRTILRRVDKLYGTRHCGNPNFSNPNSYPRLGDVKGLAVTWYSRDQYLLFRRSGLLSGKEERELKRVDKYVRRELKRKGIRDVESNGSPSAPAGVSSNGGSPKGSGSAGKQDGSNGGGSPVTGGARSVDTYGDSGSIYLPWDLSSSRRKKVSRTFLGREEWQRIEGIVDRASSP